MTEDPYHELSKQIGQAKAMLKLVGQHHIRLYDQSRLSDAGDEFYCMTVIEKAAAEARSSLKAARKEAKRRIKDIVRTGGDGL